MSGAIEIRNDPSDPEREEIFRQIAETVREVFWVGSPDWKKVYYVSPAYEEVWGRACQSLYDNPLSWIDSLHEDDREAVLAGIEAAVRSKAVDASFPEYRVVRPDGSWRWVLARAYAIQDDSGQIVRIAGIAEDITEYRRAQQDYQLLFREMLNGFALHEIICDEPGNPVDYRFLAVNPAFERLTGLKADGVVGRTVRDVMPNIEQRWIDTYGQVALSGTPVQFEEYSQALGKHYVVSAFQPSSGQFACIIEDVTDRKRAEREREELIAKLESQNAELERFTYTVSHDLKSPLITITGYIGMLAEALARRDLKVVKEDLTRISDAAHKMAVLLEDLLELSRIGRLVNPPESVPVKELAADALQLLDGPLHDRGVEMQIPPGLPAVFGDRTRLREVFLNLIDNAVKYMGSQAQPKIEIGAHREGTEVVCYVRDNGMGIEPRFHEKVFGLFDQLDPAVEGSGIGLALVKRIVELHGGRIWIESEGKDRGSTFWFTLAAESDK